jgi:hypothetical protein
MTDKEVGKLWRDHLNCLRFPEFRCDHILLIRKLVEERVKRLPISGLGGALHDFAIDQKEWK